MPRVSGESYSRWSNSESLTSKIGAGFIAGLSSFRCMLVRLGAEGANAKALRINMLRLLRIFVQRPRADFKSRASDPRYHFKGHAYT